MARLRSGPRPAVEGRSERTPANFSAPALHEQLRRVGREAMLYFTFNSAAIAVFVAHNLRQGEWVAGTPTAIAAAPAAAAAAAAAAAPAAAAPAAADNITPSARLAPADMIMAWWWWW